MLQPAVDITTSVHKFETILYQFKRDNLNEVDQSHYQKIMGLSVPDECPGRPEPVDDQPP